jgi:glycosyltransferase involved in cell wall biosynthesis
MRKVMIGTPCYDGRLDVWYTNSLVNTIKLSYEKNVEIIPMWVSFDALIQRARNDTIQIALDLGVDDLVWIDSDIEWEPEWFFKLLEYPVDVVGGTYRKKGDKEEYVYRAAPNTRLDPVTGLIETSGLGTGFVRMSKSAMQHLWDTSKPYIDPKDNRERRMIFDVVIENGSLVSEDIKAFFKLAEGGFKIWMDPAMTCNHTGPYKFKGDYQQWAKSGRNPNNITAPAIVKPAPQLPRRQL